MNHYALTFELKDILRTRLCAKILYFRGQFVWTHVGKRLLQRHRDRLLQLYGHRGLCLRTAILQYLFHSKIVDHFINPVKTHIGIDKIYVLHLAQIGHPLLRNIAVAHHGCKHSGRCGGIAVRILATATRHLHGLAKIAVAIEQTHHNIRTIHRGIYVARLQNQFGTTHVFAPLLVILGPTIFPIIGIFLVPLQHIADAGIKLALLGNKRQSLANNALYIVLHKGKTIHRTHKNTTIPTITIVNHVADTVTNGSSLIGHTRSHQTGEICLNLKVYAICMGMARKFRTDTVANIITPQHIGMPQGIFGIGKSPGKLFKRSVKSYTVENIYKGEIHINVVIQTGNMVKIIFQMTIGIFNHPAIGNHHSAITKLRGASKGTAYRLAGPATLNLVEQHRLVNS